MTLKSIKNTIQQKKIIINIYTSNDRPQNYDEAKTDRTEGRNSCTVVVEYINTSLKVINRTNRHKISKEVED